MPPIFDVFVPATPNFYPQVLKVYSFRPRRPLSMPLVEFPLTEDPHDSYPSLPPNILKPTLDMSTF